MLFFPGLSHAQHSIVLFSNGLNTYSKNRNQNKNVKFCVLEECIKLKKPKKVNMIQRRVK